MAEKKTPAVSPATESAADPKTRKTAAKAPARRGRPPLAPELYVELNGKQYNITDVIDRAKADYRATHKVGGIDILLTHAPASGLNDGTDRAHKGFVCFNELLDEYQPAWFVHGHVHLNYDAKLPRVCTCGNTTVINATERYVFEIPDPDPLQKRKFLWGSAKK